MKNKAFVLMPFSEVLNDVYEHLIKGALVEAGYEVERADDIKSQSNILEDIVKGIFNSDLIVADLTDSNPNVYYELGIAHALQKKVVLITQEINELPFDLKSYRALGYSTHFARMNTAKIELVELARKALIGAMPFGNPVKDYGMLQKSPINKHTDDSKSGRDNKSTSLGFLDHIVQYEENINLLVETLELVSSKLLNELTPSIADTTAKLHKHGVSIKKKRDLVKKLAESIEDFSHFLNPKNDQYSALNTKLETSIEFILAPNEDFIEVSAEEVEAILDVFESMGSGAEDARNGFVDMLEEMKVLPNLEANFQRANKEMQRQIQLFIDNVERTISMSARAKTLSKSLLNRMLS